jgi:hypothetical protein
MDDGGDDRGTRETGTTTAKPRTNSTMRTSQQLHSLIILFLPAKEGVVALLARCFHFYYLRPSISMMTDGVHGGAGCRKKKQQSSKSLVTSVPDFDGYQWRKYGQKQIEGAMYPRYVII